MSGEPKCCLQYDESQQDTVAKIFDSSSLSNVASLSRSFPSETQVLESSCAATYAPANSVEPEKINKLTLHTPKFGRSSVAVYKPSGIGLHLNSLFNALPMGCGASASVKSADADSMFVQGKKSFCTTDFHSAENAGNSPTSSKAVDDLLVRTEEMERTSRAYAVATFGNLCPHSTKRMHNPVLLQKPTEHYSTSCDKREYTTLSPQEKRQDCINFFIVSTHIHIHSSISYVYQLPSIFRKRSRSFSDEDGCKSCNCKKTKCLKLYVVWQFFFIPYTTVLSLHIQLSCSL